MAENDSRPVTETHGLLTLMNSATAVAGAPWPTGYGRLSR